MTTLTDEQINAQLDEFERLAELSAARRRAQDEEAVATERARAAAEQAATATELKEQIRACLNEYLDLVRTLDTCPINPDAWRDLHLAAVRGNRAISRLTGQPGFHFTSPVGGGFIRTVFGNWAIECEHSASREKYNASIKRLSQSLNVAHLQKSVEQVLSR